MDVAPITITQDSSNKYPFKATIQCNTINFGIMNFTFIQGQDNWFMKYLDYPIVRCATGNNLFQGLDLEYEILLLPTTGKSEEVTLDNITDFYIGVRAKDG